MRYIPSLHVTRHFGHYLKLTDEYHRQTIVSYGVMIGRWMYRSMGIIQSITDAISQRPQKKKEAIQSKVDVIIVSHGDEIAVTHKDVDRYFGGLHRDLEEMGLRVCYAYTNKNRIDFEKEAPRISRPSQIFIPNILSISEELDIWIQVIASSIGAFVVKKFSKDARSNRAISVALSHSFEAIPVIRLGKYMSKVCKELQPKYLIYTYEGHSWERAMLYYCRRSNSSITCIGYQHSSIFPAQFSSRMKYVEQETPNILLCSSPQSTKYFRRSYLREPCPKVVYSGRIQDEKGGDIESTQRGEASTEQDYDILVVAGGEEAEYTIMIKFICSYKNKYKSTKIRVRLHPLTKQAALSYVRKTDIKGELSIGNDDDVLLDELKRSKCVLYRDSTLILKAIRLGRTPVFLNNGRALSLNPLHFEKSSGARSVKTIDELHEIVTEEKLKRRQVDWNRLEITRPYKFENIQNIFQ